MSLIYEKSMQEIDREFSEYFWTPPLNEYTAQKQISTVKPEPLCPKIITAIGWVILGSYFGWVWVLPFAKAMWSAK